MLEGNALLYTVIALAAAFILPRLNLGPLGALVSGFLTKLKPADAPLPTDKAGLIKELADLLLPLLMSRLMPQVQQAAVQAAVEAQSNTGPGFQATVPTQTSIKDTADGITVSHPNVTVELSKK